MALLICPECDSKVSDKAQCCPNCGFPVKDIIEIECKALQESKRTKQKKILEIVLSVIVLCVVVVGAMTAIKRPDTSGLYNKIAWGSSETQIKKEYPKGTEGADDDKENETYYLYNMKSYMDGIDALTHFLLRMENCIRLLLCYHHRIIAILLMRKFLVRWKSTFVICMENIKRIMPSTNGIRKKVPLRCFHIEAW